MTDLELHTIQFEQDGPIATVTLNRPHRLNAYTPQMRDELLTVLDRIDADDTIRVMILTGAGRGFCAGADMKETDGLSSDDIMPGATFKDGTPRDGPGMITLRMFELKKPIIAAINGAAVGAGATIPLAADVRLASESARLRFVFSRLGIVPEGASTWFLPRLVGPQVALEWMLSSRMISAQEATSSGYFLSLVPPSYLMPKAFELAEIFAQGAPVSAALIRRLVWDGLVHDHPLSSHRADSFALQHTSRLPDASEGSLALREKRTPAFSGAISRDYPKNLSTGDTPA